MCHALSVNKSLQCVACSRALLSPMPLLQALGTFACNTVAFCCLGWLWAYELPHQMVALKHKVLTTLCVSCPCAIGLLVLHSILMCCGKLLQFKQNIVCCTWAALCVGSSTMPVS
ncbi:hypothetical protein COO60DRAFT_475568 [Scenedesmus sp. NREL 46B-D3]|nr:hypothetical protein COO60DRAFT_475568 [Scenedesmus sp. NREL 46B-D3]